MLVNNTTESNRYKAASKKLQINVNSGQLAENNNMDIRAGFIIILGRHSLK